MRKCSGYIRLGLQRLVGAILSYPAFPVASYIHFIFSGVNTITQRAVKSTLVKFGDHEAYSAGS